VLLTARQVTSRGQAAAPLALHHTTVAAWLRRSRDGGLEAFVTWKEAGAPAGQKTLPPAVFAPRTTRLATPTGLASDLDVQRWLPRSIGSGGPLHHPPWPWALSAQGHAAAPTPSPGQNNLAAAADLVQPCPRRLGTIAPGGRPAPDPSVAGRLPR
jgi:hypothetical protein